MEKAPLILTIAIETNAFDFFNKLRKQYFPAERNFLDAHLTLFHALPNETSTIEIVKLVADLSEVFTLQVTGPVSIGRGVAFKLVSGELLQIHQELQNKFWQNLSRQDQQKLWPHITIQNKVTANEAKVLLSELKESFIPFSVKSTGLQLWEYLNGPWKLKETFTFRPSKL